MLYSHEIAVILIFYYLQFVVVECIITSISDLFPKFLRKPGRSEIFVLLVCLSSFLSHLILVTEVNKLFLLRRLQTVVTTCFLY